MATPNVWAHTTSHADGYWLQSSLSGPLLPLYFWLFVFHWLMLRLRALHVWISCGHLLRSPIRHASRLVSKVFLRFGGQAPKVFWSLRHDSFTKMLLYKPALFLTMWLFQIHPTEEGGVDVSCTGPTRIQLSRRGYWLLIRFDLHHRWLVCLRRSCSFWSTTSCLKDVLCTWRIPSLSTAVLQILILRIRFLTRSVNLFL